MKFQRNKFLNKAYNLMCRRFSSRLNTICISTLLCMFIYYGYLNIYFKYWFKPSHVYLADEFRNYSVISTIKLNPRCLCQKDTVIIREFKDFYNIRIENYIDSLFYSYNLTRNFFEQLTVTCSLYKVLRRGPNQKIISYSISSNDDKVSLKYILKTNIKRAKLFYTNWFIRVYHKSRLTLNEECEYECYKYNKNVLFDNIDMCDATHIPIDLYRTWNVSYVLPQVLRYLPVGDDMVDIMISRDMTTCLFEREVAAVNDWLKSGFHFHSMRDHPDHTKNILGGMWGNVNKLNKKFSKQMLNIITDKTINEWFKSYDVSLKPDELVLEQFVWPLVVNSSMIHDSYTCKNLPNFRPFPIQRNPKNCHVGQIGCCGSKLLSKSPYIRCPKQCRLDESWLYC